MLFLYFYHLYQLSIEWLLFLLQILILPFLISFSEK
jgi:hypothetical protein